MPVPSPSSRLLLAVCLATGLPAAARADSYDTFNASVGVSRMRDSNLFRQAPGREESDELSSTSVALSLSKPYGLQRFALDATLIDYRYDNNDYLNFLAKNYNAAWNWSLTPRFHGTLSSGRAEAQNSFVDYQPATPELRRNLRRNDTQRFAAEWEVSGGLHVLGGLNRSTQTNSQTFFQQSGYELTNRELGLKYLWRAGTYLQLLHRQGDGEYKERQFVPFSILPAPFNPQIDNSFRQTETEARFFVPLTGKTAATARLGRLAREHRHFQQRDFAAYVGHLDFQWQPTAKLSLSASLRRDIAAYQDFASSYYLADGFTFQPAWEITPKTALRLRFDQERRRYDGAIVAGGPERSDTIRSARLALDWSPRRWGSLSASIQRDSRDSGLSGLDYRSTMISLAAQISF